jgi:integrase
MTDDGKKQPPGIEQLGPNRWAVRAQARDPRTGRKISKRDVVTGTRREAQLRQVELRGELRDSGPRRRRVQMRTYCSTWLASRLPDLKPSVVHKYKNNLHLHIIPALGDLYVDAILPSDVRAFISAKLKQLAGNTVLNMLRLLRTIAKDAMAEGLTDRDFCARIEAPKVDGYTDEDPNLLDAEQLGRLLVAIPKQWLPIVLVLAYTGMRWGEASGLRWMDIDVAAGTIKVRRSNWRGIETEPKTAGSKRVAPLPPRVIELLGKRPSKRNGGATALVFPVRSGAREGNAHMGAPLLKVLRRACAAADVPHITTHGLRRTFNNLARQVTDRLVAMSIVGHTTDAMHEHYSKVGIGEKIAAQRAVRELVEGAPPPFDRAALVKARRARGPAPTLEQLAVTSARYAEVDLARAKASRSEAPT